MDSVQIVYLASAENKHSSVYDMNGVYLGYFSGYNTRPGAQVDGTIEVVLDSGENIWVSGRAKYVFGFGFKFIEPHKID